MLTVWIESRYSLRIFELGERLSIVEINQRFRTLPIVFLHTSSPYCTGFSLRKVAFITCRTSLIATLPKAKYFLGSPLRLMYMLQDQLGSLALGFLLAYAVKVYRLSFKVMGLGLLMFDMVSHNLHFLPNQNAGVKKWDVNGQNGYHSVYPREISCKPSINEKPSYKGNNQQK